MARFDTDVLVIGGGPAGLAFAIAALQHGFRVMLADAAHPPIDKACGEGLMPDALFALAALEVPVTAAMGLPFRGIRFIDGEISVDAPFGRNCGLAARRTELHQALAERAEHAGVELRWGTPARSLTPDGALLGEEPVSCQWLIGADGGNSPVRRWAGFKVWERGARYGFRRHYQTAPWTDMVEVLWGPEFQIYVAPIGPQEVGIALLCRDPELRIDDALAFFPKLAGQLAGAPHLSLERGGISAMRKLPSVTQGHIALIGDASGAVDAITGQGMCLSFQQALALADSLAAGNLEAYEIAHRRIMRRPRLMANLLLHLDRHPRARRKVMRIFERHPTIFAALLAYHSGAVARTVQRVLGHYARNSEATY